MFAHEIDVKDGTMGFESLILCCVDPLLYAAGEILDITHTDINVPEEVEDLKMLMFLDTYKEKSEKLRFFTAYLYDNMRALKDKMDEFGEEFDRLCNK